MIQFERMAESVREASQIIRTAEETVTLPTSIAKQLLAFAQSREQWIQPEVSSLTLRHAVMPKEDVLAGRNVWLQLRGTGLMYAKILWASDSEACMELLTDRKPWCFPIKSYNVSWRCWAEMPTIEETEERWSERV